MPCQFGVASAFKSHLKRPQECLQGPRGLAVFMFFYFRILEPFQMGKLERLHVLGIHWVDNLRYQKSACCLEKKQCYRLLPRRTKE